MVLLYISKTKPAWSDMEILVVHVPASVFLYGVVLDKELAQIDQRVAPPAIADTVVPFL